MTSFSYEAVRLTISDHFAFAVGEGQKISQTVMSIFPAHDDILIFGYIFTLLFQFSCIIPIFHKRSRHLFAYLAISFHFSTYLFLGINFGLTILAVLFFIIFRELVIKPSSNNNELMTL